MFPSLHPFYVVLFLLSVRVRSNAQQRQLNMSIRSATAGPVISSDSNTFPLLSSPNLSFLTYVCVNTGHHIINAFYSVIGQLNGDAETSKVGVRLKQKSPVRSVEPNMK